MIDIGWKELLLDSRGGDGTGLYADALSRGSASRVYKVWGYSRESVIANPIGILGGDTGTEPLPGYNTPHPVFPSMRLERYSVSADGSFTIATALYSSTNRFRYPAQVDRAAPDRYALSGRIDGELAQTITIARRMPIDVSNGEQSATLWVWSPFETTALHASERMQVEVTVHGLSIQHRAAFHRQVNRLHRFDDSTFETPDFYRFLGASYSEREPGIWTVRYEWTSDPGTRHIDITGIDPAMVRIPLAVNWWDGDNYVRPPFHQLVYVPNPGGTHLDPSWAVVALFTREDFGWQTLPGL